MIQTSAEVTRLNTCPTAEAGTTCTDRGQCKAANGGLDTCSCYYGFQADDCSEVIDCSSHNCSHRGVCTCGGKCDCDYGWILYRIACAFPECKMCAQFAYYNEKFSELYFTLPLRGLRRDASMPAQVWCWYCGWAGRRYRFIYLFYLTT